MTEEEPIHGTFGGQKALAKRIADETLMKAQEEPQPKLATIYFYIVEAFVHATRLAGWSRNSTNADPAQFVARYTYLAEYLDRVAILQKEDRDIFKDWPENPDVTFSWQAGWCALDVARNFGEIVRNGIIYGRVSALGPSRREYEKAKVSPEPDPRVVQWFEVTMKEFREKTLPDYAEQQMWKINRDFKRMLYKMGNEYTRACKVKAARGTPEKPREEQQTTFKNAPTLNDAERNIIEALDREKLTGEKLAAKAGYPYNSNFKATLSSLRKRNILRNEAPGYVLESKHYHFLNISD